MDRKPSNEDASSLLAAYQWAESEDPTVEALSITLAEADEARVIEILAPRAEWPVPLTVAEALDATLEVRDFAWGSVLAQMDSLEGWTVVVEPNGWAASDPDVLSRLSVEGVAVNVYWNVNALIRFSLARNGTLVREFDALLYDDTDAPLPEEAGLRWGTDQPRASALAVMERTTGVRIEREWLLNTPRSTFVVPLRA